jgi:hypothetical protein
MSQQLTNIDPALVDVELKTESGSVPNTPQPHVRFRSLFIFALFSRTFEEAIHAWI